MIFLELTKINLLLQFRNRQIFLATIFFSVFLVFLFTLAFPSNTPLQPEVYSGVFWISSFFSGNLVLASQSQIHTNQFQHGLLLTGVDAIHIFFSKVITSLIHLIVIQVVVLALMNMFFSFPADISFASLFLYCILGSIGYVSIGTLFFSLIEFHNVKDLLITILFYPVIIPLFLYLHKSTTMIFSLKTPNILDFVLGYDLIFVFLPALLYEFLIEDNA